MINKTDLFIYCDWLIDDNINIAILRTIIDHTDSGIININQLGTDISDGDGSGGYYEAGYGNSDDDDDGYGDVFGDGYGNWPSNGYGNGSGDGYGNGLDCVFDLLWDDR